MKSITNTESNEFFRQLEEELKVTLRLPENSKKIF